MSKVSGGYGTGVAGLCRLALLFTLAAAASGCTSMQALERESAARSIEPGDTVFVSIRDGRELELAFDGWSSDGLTGTDETGILQKIDNEDIDNVQVKRLSVWKNVGLAVVVVGILAKGADDIVDGIEEALEVDEEN